MEQSSNESISGALEMKSTQGVDDTSACVASFLSSRTFRPPARSSIVFENLVVEGAGKGSQAVSTVRSYMQALPQVLYPRTYHTPEPSRTLLHGFAGTINSGEMLLVIGKPGSGCTTFLKTLADMHGEYKATTGYLTYGGHPAAAPGLDPIHATFCAEEDAHLPRLTVRETLRFAIRATCHATMTRNDLDTAVEALASCFGLNRVLDTRVGDEAIRGVSGGERRRVTLAEAVASCAEVLCLDNPTKGLDASTALEVLQTIRELTNVRGCASIVSLYQGSDTMAALFDKVLIIKGGRQIFYGTVGEAKSYFESLGFVCPERTAITDFLSSMTGDVELCQVRDGYEYRVPRDPEQFEQAFRASKYYEAVQDAVAVAKRREYPPAPPAQIYCLPVYIQVTHCAIRQFRVLIRDHRTWGLEIACLVVQSLFLGTLFRDQKQATGSFFSLTASLFYAVLVPSLRAMNEFNHTFAQRELVIRQRRYRFYRPLSYALGQLVPDATAAFAAIICNLPQYFMTGFQADAGRFFSWLCILYIEHLALSMLFRTCAVFASSMERAVLPVGVAFNAFVMYAGLYVTPKDMQVWLAWFRYLNPMYYAFESIVANEFGNLDYICSDNDMAPRAVDHPSQFTNSVCAVPGAESGTLLVSGSSYIRARFDFEASHIWRNVAINIAFFVFFAAVSAVGMERYKLPAGRMATVFYKAEPKQFSSESAASSDVDREKGTEEQGHGLPPFAQTSTGDTAHRRMSARAQPSQRPLVWKELAVDVKAREGTRRLLDNLNGFVEPGKLTALMGMSGAGKTTLLNALAGRLEAGILTGSISLGAEPLPKSFSSRMGYVHQEDVHLPSQTVREALQMTSRLKTVAGKSHSEQGSNAYVEEVIAILEMDNIADALIGVPGTGLNLEQRKRVSIGVELAAQPEILFLDEPTSGLDGQSAMKIAILMRKLSAQGFTVLCTIHQPAAQLIECFDHLVLLARGGKLVYDGPLGNKCDAAIAYFGRHARPCEPHENPAEYFLDVVGAGSRSSSRVDWADAWRESDERKQRETQLASLTRQQSHGHALQHASSDTESGASSVTRQMTVLFRRTWLYYWREPEYLVAKLAMSGASALLNGLTYLNPPATPSGASSRVFSTFVSLIVGPPLALQAVPRFIVLRDIYTLRERARGTYRWPALLVSALAVELPYALLSGIAYWLLWYYPVFHEDVGAAPDRAGYSLLAYLLFSLWTHALAQVVSAAAPSAAAALATNGFVFFLLNTFAGTLSPRPATPAGWRWFFYVSPLFYLAEGTVTSVLQGLQLRCGEADAVLFSPPANTTCGAYAAGSVGYVMNPSALADCRYCRYGDGPAYYAQYAYDFARRWRNIGVFISFLALNYMLVFGLTYLKVGRVPKRS